MPAWFHERIVETGRLPLFCFFVAMLGTFGLIRLSVRLIRAKVRWWPGNIRPGGLHIHHAIFGVVLMIVGGVAGMSVADAQTGWLAVTSSLFGVGTALVLDEFALILHLRDVYWTEQGRTSVDAVFVALAVTGLLLLGIRPFGLGDMTVVDAQGRAHPDAARILFAGSAVVNGALAVLTLLKGKIWTGLLGLFVPPFLLIGAVRLGRPGSPWARWRYRRDRGPRAARKLERAIWREVRLRRPLIRGKIWFQELISGRHEPG